MIERLWARYHDLSHRVRRIERREIREFRGWIEHTSNLTRLSVVLFVPLLIATVTLLSNSVSDLVPFLLFPPLAAGTYTLFSDPSGRYSSPWQFVAGLTLGAFSGFLSLDLTAIFVYRAPPPAGYVDPGSAALSVFLVAIATWALGIDLPTAFSTALLVLVTGTPQLVYVLGVALSSSLVAVVFVVWRRQFYDQRAQYLYQSLGSDDHVLVPIRGESPEVIATFGAQLAAAHDAGKVVLVDLVPDAALANAEKKALNELNTEARLFDDGGEGGGMEREERSPATTDTSPTATGTATAPLDPSVERAAGQLERQAARIRAEFDVPCEVIVAVDGNTLASTTILETAREANCDLIVTPYEAGKDGTISPFVRELFRGRNVDVVALRTDGTRSRWTRVLVPVRKAGNVAHRMIDFAYRLAGAGGRVSVCTCITRETQRRSAETMLADLVEAFPGESETRISRASIEEFLTANAAHHDLVIIGASTDRSKASRFFSPPTFERLSDLDCDLAIVDYS